MNTSDRSRMHPAAALALVFLLVVGAFAAGFQWIGRPLVGEPVDAAIGVLTVLAVLALVVERASAVVNLVIHGEETNDNRHKLSIALARAPFMEVEDADEELRVVQTKISLLEDKKTRVRIVTALVLSGFIATAGIRVLQPLVGTEDALGNQIILPPVWIFVLADVLLTSLLIAGGGQGIAEIISTIRGWTSNGSAPLRKALSRATGGDAQPDRYSELSGLPVRKVPVDYERLKPIYLPSGEGGKEGSPGGETT